MGTLKEGDQLGQYRLVARLGVGGVGEVWKATHVDMPGDPVAVKVPTQAQVAATLRGQAGAQNHITHPNVVKVVYADLAHEPPFVVMEYVEGETLAARLRARGKLPVAEAVRIARQVLLALAAAHAGRAVHGDLKPENVMLTPDGRVKLTDFGFYRFKGEAEELSRSLEVSRAAEWAVATLAYMAPEQRRGCAPGVASDVYAAGLLLHEMLTGHNGRLRFPVRDVPLRVSAIVERATEDEPGRRYADAAAMLKELRRCRATRLAAAAVAAAGAGAAVGDRAAAADEEEDLPDAAPVAAPLAVPARGPGAATPAVYCACGRGAPADADYCGGCGRPLRVACAVCGRVNAVVAEACAQCGADIGTDALEQGRFGAEGAPRFAGVIRVRSCPKCGVENGGTAAACRRCQESLAQAQVREIPAWRRLLAPLGVFAAALPLLTLGVTGEWWWSLGGTAVALLGLAWMAARGVPADAWATTAAVGPGA